MNDRHLVIANWFSLAHPMNQEQSKKFDILVSTVNKANAQKGRKTIVSHKNKEQNKKQLLNPIVLAIKAIDPKYDFTKFPSEFDFLKTENKDGVQKIA